MEKRELRGSIQLQILFRVPHAQGVIDGAGKVEDDIDILEQRPYALDISNIRADDGHLVSDRRDVPIAASTTSHAGIDNRHLRPKLD
jgi:hypothetical protein